ncbi:MAG: caspase family protein [Magnetococcus sp. DMHC-6]
MIFFARLLFLLLYFLLLTGVQPVRAAQTCSVASEIAQKATELFDHEQNKGVEGLKQARDLCPEDLAINYNLGLALYLSGEKKAARDLWSTLHKNFPDHKNTQANLAWSTFELGDDEAAHLLAFKGFAKYPKNMALAHTKLFSLFRMGRYLEAYDWLTRAGLSGTQADEWRKMAVSYVVETVWRKFRGGEKLPALQNMVDLLVKEYADEPLFIKTKEQILTAFIDPNAAIPVETPLPHEAWPKSGPIEDQSEILDDFITTLPELTDWKKRDDAFAVLVGIHSYQYLHGRHFADRDAQNMATLLARRGLFIDHADHLRLRINQEATLEGLKADLEWLIQRGQLNPNAMLLFYFSGQLSMGSSEKGGIREPLLVPVETRLNQLNPAHTISLNWLQEKIKNLPNKEILLLIDGCVNGTPSCSLRDTGDKTPLDRDFFTTSAPWLVASINKEAGIYGPGRQSTFTYFLLQGLLGPADGSDGSLKDGWVDLLEAFTYLKTKTHEKGVTLDPLLSSPAKIRITKVGGER